MTDTDPLVADFAARFPDAFVRALRGSSDADISRIIKTLPPASIASIAARLPARRLLALLESGEHSPVAWVEGAPFDDAVMLLSRMKRERRIALVGSLGDRSLKRRLMRHQQYPTHSAGFYVEDSFLRIEADTAIGDALDDLRSIERDDFPLLVVTDSAGRYAGVLQPSHLINVRFSGHRLRDLVQHIQPIAPETPVVVAAGHQGWMEHNWLPAVDNKQRVLGALSRAVIFRAATRISPSRQSASTLMLELVDDLTRSMGELLNGLLGGERTRS